MIKTRVIPTLQLNGEVLVKSVGFAWRRPIGVPRQAVRVYNTREVDEMVILDLDARLEARRPRLELIRDLAEECFMPLAVGGGIRTIEEVRELMKHGADKVVVNTEAVERPGFITEVARQFGSQCLVVSIDARRTDGRYEVYTHAGRQPTGLDPVRWAREVASLGAGEVLLTSMDRDGTMEGYDLELLRAVTEAVEVPVIASGGAGKLDDFVEAVRRGGASAVAAASIFQFTQVTPRTVKAHMRQAGIEVRL